MNIGPQHPSTHGVMRFIVLIYSEVIYYCHPEIGYLCRATMKLIDYFWSLPSSISYFDRIDYVSTISQEGLIVNVVERYLHSYVNDYLSAIRSLFYELSRISNHLLAVTTHGIDIGSLNCMLLAFEEREKINNLHEYLSGSRIHCSLLSVFTMRYDIPLRFLLIIHHLLINFPFLNKELHSMLSFSPIFIIRLSEIGKLDRDSAIRSSISGVIIRSVGHIIDARIFGYCIYYFHSFAVAIGSKGDCLDRYYIRMNELQQSLFLISHIILLIPFLLSPLLSSAHSASNIQKSISYFFSHHLLLLSFYFSMRLYIECPKGIQSIYIYYQPDLLSSSSYYYRHSRMDITNNDFLCIFNIQKYIQSLYLFDFIALIGSLDFVLGSIDCLFIISLQEDRTNDGYGMYYLSVRGWCK